MPFLPNAAFRRPRGWILAMNWDDLLFLHWRVEADRLRPLLPAGLALDTFEGAAWISVAAFRMPRRAARSVWLSSSTRSRWIRAATWLWFRPVARKRWL